MKFKKIVSHGIPERLLEQKFWRKLDGLCEKRVLLNEGDTRLANELADADCLLVWFNGVDKKIIDKAHYLKYIGVLATGYGKIDTAFASSKSITVTNIPGYSTESVAELVFAVLLEHLREICRAKTLSKQSRTSEADFSGMEIKGKDFGVIGLGKIGSRVAEIATGFGAKVYYWSRAQKPEHEGKYKFEELDQLVTHCDFLSINLALNDQTKNIFSAKHLVKIKRDAVVINTAPLELFDLVALNKRLSNNDLTYIFDHTDPGDITDKDLDQLRQHKNCITYPVLGYISKEAKIALQEIFVENIDNFLKGSPKNLVN